MLFRTVHLPILYQAIDNMERAALCHSILRSMIVNCVILDGTNDEIATEMLRVVRQWPIKYKDKAEKVVSQIQRNGQFIPTFIDPVGTDCPIPTCNLALMLAGSQQPDLLLVPNRCLCNGTCQREELDLTQLLDYHASDFEEERSLGEDGSVDFNEMTPAELGRLRLAPIFRHAKSVVFVDKVFGRMMLEGVARTNPRDQTDFRAGTLDPKKRPYPGDNVASNYKKTIEWIYAIFKLSAGPGVPLHICTEIPERHYKTVYTMMERHAAERALIEYAREVKRRLNGPLIDISAMLTGGQVSGEVSHDRYLLTNQVVVNIGRGLDLQTAAGQMRDTEIHIVKNKNRVIRRMQTLYPAHKVIRSLPVS